VHGRSSRRVSRWRAAHGSYALALAISSVLPLALGRGTAGDRACVLFRARLGIRPCWACTLVGAFAAGLILEDSHSAAFVARGERSLRERMEPISSWLVPIFFVLVGMRADCRALAHVESCSVVLALTLAAILGKMACAAGAPANVDRISVAIAMWPRGEVTLVFATLGATLYVGGHPLLDATQYSALVAVVVLTTLAAPPALRYWWAHAANG